LRRAALTLKSENANWDAVKTNGASDRNKGRQDVQPLEFVLNGITVSRLVRVTALNLSTVTRAVDGC